MPNEIERRFLICMDKSILECCDYIDIIQGYFKFPGLRIRLIHEEKIVTKAILGLKKGTGISREEKEKEININLGKFLLKICSYYVAKRRYLPQGREGKNIWIIDSFKYPLEGETAEIELKNKNQKIQLPPWAYEAIEITDIISSRDLAKMATKLRKNKSSCTLASLL